MRKIVTLLVFACLAFGLFGCGKTVPDVKGLTQTQARTALESSGLSLGRVSYDGKTDGATGAVVSQSPAAAEQLGRSGKVDVVIAGPPPASVEATAASASVTSAASEATPASEAEKDGTFYVSVKDLWSQDGTLLMEADYLQVYFGDKAEREAEKRGDEVWDEYYIINDNPRLRTIPLKPNGRFKYRGPDYDTVSNFTLKEFVEFYGSPYDEDSEERADQILSTVQSGSSIFIIKVKDGVVVSAEYFWTP